MAVEDLRRFAAEGLERLDTNSPEALFYRRVLRAAELEQRREQAKQRAQQARLELAGMPGSTKREWNEREENARKIGSLIRDRILGLFSNETPLAEVLPSGTGYPRFSEAMKLDERWKPTWYSMDFRDRAMASRAFNLFDRYITGEQHSLRGGREPRHKLVTIGDVRTLSERDWYNIDVEHLSIHARTMLIEAFRPAETPGTPTTQEASTESTHMLSEG